MRVLSSSCPVPPSLKVFHLESGRKLPALEWSRDARARDAGWRVWPRCKVEAAGDRIPQQPFIVGQLHPWLLGHVCRCLGPSPPAGPRGDRQRPEATPTGRPRPHPLRESIAKLYLQMRRRRGQVLYLWVPGERPVLRGTAGAQEGVGTPAASRRKAPSVPRTARASSPVDGEHRPFPLRVSPTPCLGDAGETA